ncbi:hypothetical protein DLAC_06870 [Tieghemostelium lacteum]|uniref:Tetratricopeptide-like helical domain-containing protein (TPR) n=1 Tax=Tieghemostelium lacteum TaxID=361077 RepID=A0A151ZDP1_TIELA|nr:hypothetical protein DLAC_06870 [Tieghemostelium lacteum]|eukprot:KYQ92039.1 hypothetical protein DLAC_06870 [Tieghemostelium lacteum]
MADNSTTTTNNNNNTTLDDNQEKITEQLKEISIKEKYKSNQEDIQEANALKLKGNLNYTEKDYDTAIKNYSDAIKLLLDGNQHEEKEQTEKIVEIKENDITCTEELSIYYSNRAACYLQKKEYQLVIDDCVKSLEMEPSTDSLKIKILLRRAQAKEALDMLSEALEDYKSILQLDPKHGQSLQAQYSLPPKIKVKQDKEREEMMGKLKDLGNTILGKFGMSTDNFQFVKDPNSGGYSVNFKR